MRKAISRATVVSGIALMAIVGMAIPIGADITSPTSGATVSGVVNLADNGNKSGGLIVTFLGVTISTCNGSTNMFVDSGAGTTVGATTVANLGTVSNTNGSIPQSGTWNSSATANGAYTVNSTEVKKTSSCLGTTTTNAHIPVTVTNVSTLVYGGASSGAPGQSVPVSATLTDVAGAAPPAGTTVSFALSGGPTVTATTNAAGQAATTLTVNGPPRTGATITVSYAGGFFTALSSPQAFAVTQDPTNTTISPSPATSFGQPVSYTATVASGIAGQGTPTGTVQFEADGNNIGAAQSLNGVGVAVSPSISTLTATSHAITAVYSGDSNFLTSTGNLTQVVNAATTSTSVTSAIQPTKFGQSVTFTATVTTQAPGAGSPVGTVSFTETPTAGSPQPIGGAITLSPTSNPNVATATSASIAVLDAGSYTITATFNGSANYAASSGTVGQTVDRAGTVVSVASTSPSFAVFGQPIQFTATLASVLPGVGTPTGSVDFKIDGTIDLGTVALVGGTATSPPISTLSTTELHTVVATYTNSDGNYVSGTAGQIQQFVLPDPTTTVVTSSPNPSVFGQPVTFSANVSANAPGAGVPTGIVQFFINGVPYGSSIGLVGGSASAPADAALAPGSYVISVTYANSDGNFAGSGAAASTVDTATQVVNQDSTTTTVASSQNPTVFGQSTTFTATVSANAPGAGTPTGTVTFMDGASTLGTGTLNGVVGNDQASISTASLSVGQHAISAIYGGDTDFITSTASLNQTVNQAQSSTTVTQNGAAVQGQPVSFTATIAAVAPGAGLPTGTVLFEVNGSPLGAAVPLVAGVATSQTISNLTPGSYLATALYSGDVNFLPSHQTIGQIVNAAGTSTLLSASPSTDTIGVPVTLTATVTATGPGVGNPTGTVDFYDGSALLGSGTLTIGSGGDQASLSGVALTTGSHALSAIYLGEYDFAGSTSNTVTENVGVISTTTALVSSLNPSAFGQSVTVTATVTPSSNAGPGPTGSVTFKDGSTVLATVPLAHTGSTFTAAFTSSTLSAGAHSLTATYGADSNYGGSTSAVLTQTVNKAATTLVAAQATTGGVVSATLTTAQGPLAGQTITFTIGSTALCSATTGANGVATCTATGLGGLQLLTSNYTASYAGNASYLPSTATGKAA